MKIVTVIATMLLLAGCTPQQPSYTEVRLPSGKVIKVLRTGTIYFSQDSPALMLKYQTDYSIDDKPALEKEVAEIWATFRADVERANVANAIIAANEAPQGRFITQNRSFNFVFQKSSDGTWKQQ